MKFLSAILVAAGLLTSLSLQSCSDDEKDEPAAPAAKSVTGSYTGDMDIAVMGTTETTEDVTFTLSATDDTHATLTFPTYGNPPMQIQSFDIPGLAVTKEGDTYKIARQAHPALHPPVRFHAHGDDRQIHRQQIIHLRDLKDLKDLKKDP